MNVRVAEVYHILVHRVDEHLVVNVHGSLGDRKIRSLTNEVLQPVVAVLLKHPAVVKWVLVWEEGACQWLVPALRRIVHALTHVCLFSIMSENATRSLIPINESQLHARLVEKNGLHHAVSAARVGDHAVKCEGPEDDHYWQHNRVSSVERVFLNAPR